MDAISLGLVAFDRYPDTVPEELIQAIRHHVDTINAAGEEQFQGFKRGETVLIQGGLFDGYEAIFDKKRWGPTKGP